MCGIAGFVELTGAPADRDLLRRMADTISHRGPDDQGHYLDGPVALGHRRLSIIDLSGGHQPMANEDGTRWVIYNGEIYNYPELRRELIRLGHHLQTDGDTEVLVHAWEEWGADCVKRFRGMFAFAIYDQPAQKLFLARDRVGIKPLLYGRAGGRFVFGSEMQALLPGLGQSLTLDLDALDNYLQWQYVPAPLSIWREVRKLMPGHHLTLDLRTGQEKIERYWRLVFAEEKDLSLAEWEDQLDSAIREAVRIRLRSDVPFGAFLSGGVDSSLVVAYMSELMDRPVDTFSIGFEIGEWSELAYAEQAARMKRTSHHVQTVRPDALELLPMLARHYGEPYADSSAMPTYYVSRMAAGHVKMVLSGDGGDESFAGYHAYQTVCNQLAAQEGARVAKEMPPLPKFFLKRWVAKLRLRQRRLADPSGEGDQALFLFSQCMSHFPYPERQKLYRPEMQRALADRVAERREFFAGSDQPLVSRLQNTDIHTYLPYDILTKVDIASMANSLEVRVPLLDHLVLELAARVPAEFKLRRCDTPQGLAFEKKFILRNVAKRYYPTDFIDRPKMGFGIPLGPWFKNELRDYIDQRLRRSQRLLALMEPRGVGEVLDTHFNHWDNSYRIWNLLFLDEWLAQNSGYRLPA